MRVIDKIMKNSSVLALSLAMTSVSFAQSSDQIEDTQIDEIIVKGTTSWEGHKGMDAFRAGDYATAEFEFEKEFKSLRRAESSLNNAAFFASSGIELDQAINQVPNADIPTGPGAGFTVSTSAGAPQISLNGDTGNKRSKGQNILNDGKITYKDFAVTSYMAGLSEIKLKKYPEAKRSFEKSLTYDGGNVDARMRLGLLHLIDNDLNKAAKQLQKIEKLRQKCKKKNCEDYKFILNSAKTLADEINKKIDLR